MFRDRCVGTLKSTGNKPIVTDQLRASDLAAKMRRGNTNQLFFAAGPHENLAGRFGAITHKPEWGSADRLGKNPKS